MGLNIVQKHEDFGVKISLKPLIICPLLTFFFEPMQKYHTTPPQKIDNFMVITTMHMYYCKRY